MSDEPLRSWQDLRKNLRALPYSKKIKAGFCLLYSNYQTYGIILVGIDIIL